MRRVLILIHTPFYGGLHNIFSKIAPSMRDKGYEIVVACPSEGPGIERLTAEGVKCVGLPLHRLRRTLNPITHLKTGVGMFTDVRSIRRAIRDNDIDLVVIQGLVNPHGGFAANAEGIPAMWEIHSDFAPMWLRKLMMPLVRKLTDTIMVSGKRIAKLHPGSESFGERMVLFSTPVNVREFVKNDALRVSARAELGVADHELLVGTVGVRTFQKGHEYLVEAAKLVRAEVPHATFRILGAPVATGAAYYEREVIQRAEKLGLIADGTIRFVDPGRRVRDLMPAFDVFTLSSRSEGIPTVMLEAMSCEIPTVCTDVGSIGDVIAHDSDGLLVPKEDPHAMAQALIRVLKDAALRKQFAIGAREGVRGVLAGVRR